MKIYIWGTGVMASKYLETSEVKEEDIVGFIESKKRVDSFRGKKVYEPHEVKDDYDYILVLVDGFGREIYNICKGENIDTSRLILLDNWEWADGSAMNRPFRECCRKINNANIDVKKIFPILQKWIHARNQEGKFIAVYRNDSDFIDKDALLNRERFLGEVYQYDYFRYRTFELMANEILKQRVEGNVAELGVYRGMFSALINAKFYDRKMYLFDTFESFEPGEFQEEVAKGRCESTMFADFKNTSVELVLANMPYRNQCIVKKGLFPGTAVGLENESYAFVSIDADLEKSTLEGLRYFYPRVNSGGAIFVHDFNHSGLGGIKVAIDKYQEEIGRMLCKVPLADSCGTLVIVKQ